MKAKSITLSPEIQASIKAVRRTMASGRPEPLKRTLERIVNEHAALTEEAVLQGEMGVSGVFDVPTLASALRSDAVRLIPSSEDTETLHFVRAVTGAVRKLGAASPWVNAIPAEAPQ